jgi:DNA polymerase kappa
MTPEAGPNADEKLPAEKDESNGSAASEHASLKYSLLGPSLTKAGQDSVDQSKACSPLSSGRVPALTLTG